MKKNLLVSSIALAAAAGFGSTAVVADENTKISGNLQLAVVIADDSENTDTSFIDNGSTFKIQHKHEISPGLEAFAKVELEFTADNKKASNGIDSLDEAFIGLKGDFGKVWAGSDDSVYEKVDVIDMFEGDYGLAGDLAGMYEGDTVHYETPDLGPMKFMVTYEINDDASEHLGAVVAQYKMDDIKVLAGYAKSNTDDIEDTWGVGLEAGLGDLTLAAQYENNDETNLFGVAAMMAMGASPFGGGIGYTDDDDDSTYAVQLHAGHNLSDNLFAYVEVYYEDEDEDENDDSDDSDGFTHVQLGAIYSF